MSVNDVAVSWMATSLGAGFAGFRKTRGTATNGWLFGKTAAASRKMVTSVLALVQPNGGTMLFSAIVVVLVTVMAEASTAGQLTLSVSVRS